MKLQDELAGLAMSQRGLVEESRRLKRQADLCARDQGLEVEEARRWQVEAQRLAGLLEAQDKLEQGRVYRVEEQLRAELRRMVEQERALHEPAVLQAQNSAEELAEALEELRKTTEARERVESSAYEVWKREENTSWVEAARDRAARERVAVVRSAEDEAMVQCAKAFSEECAMELAERQHTHAMAEGQVEVATSRATEALEALSIVRAKSQSEDDALAARLVEAEAESSEALAEAEDLRTALRELNEDIAKEEQRAASEESRARGVSFAQETPDRSAEPAPSVEDLQGRVDHGLCEVSASELKLHELEGELAENRSATKGADQEAEALRVQLQIKAALQEEANEEIEAELVRLRALDFTGEIEALQSRLDAAEAELAELGG